MKIIQTFWTGNIPKATPLDSAGGWLSPEYNWMSWALSCLQLKKIYGGVELFTDALGKKILIDILHLPYSKVSVVLDHVLDGYPGEVWALSKMHTYSLQEEPFLHFDGDLFLWEPVSYELLKADILVQNKEQDLSLYRYTLDQINSEFTNVPSWCQPEAYNDKPVVSINAGIIGGNNLDFFKKHREAAFNFISGNLEHLHKVKTNNLNFIFEQYFLYCMAEEAGIPISYVSGNVVDSLVYGVYVNFSRIPEIQFIHPVSGHKKSIHVCDHLSKFLRLEYPDMYEFILNTTRQAGVTLFNKVYISNNQVTPDTGPLKEMDFYQRTHAAIRYLADRPVQSEEDLQLLSEIYGIEKMKKRVFQDIYGDEQRLYSLCQQDLKEFEKLRSTFRLQPAVLSQVEIVRNCHSAGIPVANDWICHEMGNVGELVKDNFGSPGRIAEQMVFVPKITRMDLDEYILDGLDGILFNYCATAKPIQDILHHMTGYFEKEEVESNYDAFAHLIIDSISRLCYLDVLCIKK
jgi:hypothetical protein